MGCAVLPYLKSLVDIVENGLKDEIYIKWPKDQNPQLNETHFSKPDPNP